MATTTATATAAAATVPGCGIVARASICTGGDDLVVLTRRGFASACGPCAALLDDVAAALAPKSDFDLRDVPF